MNFCSYKEIIVFAAIFLLYPNTVLSQNLTLKEMKDLLADEQDIYVEEDKTTYKGIDVFKLWERAGIKPHALYGSDEYLYNCKVGLENSCYLYYPSIKEYSKSNIKVLRVTGSIPWDYQYYFFRKDNNQWVYFDHIDINMQKYAEPKLVFLRDSLLYLKILVASGTSNYENRYDIYSIQENTVKPLCNILADGWHEGWGLLIGRRFKSGLKYSQNKLSVNYTISLYAYNEDVDYETGGFPLLKAKRKVLFNWDGEKLLLDRDKSQLTPKDLENLFNGGHKEYYAMFKPEFDNLQNRNKKRRGWYSQFIEQIRDCRLLTEKFDEIEKIKILYYGKNYPQATDTILLTPDKDKDLTLALYKSISSRMSFYAKDNYEGFESNPLFEINFTYKNGKNERIESCETGKGIFRQLSNHEYCDSPGSNGRIDILYLIRESLKKAALNEEAGLK